MNFVSVFIRLNPPSEDGTSHPRAFLSGRSTEPSWGRFSVLFCLSGKCHSVIDIVLTVAFICAPCLQLPWSGFTLTFSSALFHSSLPHARFGGGLPENSSTGFQWAVFHLRQSSLPFPTCSLHLFLRSNFSGLLFDLSFVWKSHPGDSGYVLMPPSSAVLSRPMLHYLAKQSGNCFGCFRGHPPVRQRGGQTWDHFDSGTIQEDLKGVSFFLFAAAAVMIRTDSVLLFSPR